MTTREDIMAALMTALAGTAGTVQRNTTEVVDVRSTGTVIVRDGVSTILEQSLSADRTFYMELIVSIELYVPGETAAKRATRMDNLTTSVYTAIDDDLALNALVAYAEVTVSDAETLALDGTEDTSACVLSARFEYDSAVSIG